MPCTVLLAGPPDAAFRQHRQRQRQAVRVIVSDTNLKPGGWMILVHGCYRPKAANPAQHLDSQDLPRPVVIACGTKPERKNASEEAFSFPHMANTRTREHADVRILPSPRLFLLLSAVLTAPRSLAQKQFGAIPFLPVLLNRPADG